MQQSPYGPHRCDSIVAKRAFCPKDVFVGSRLLCVHTVTVKAKPCAAFGNLLREKAASHAKPSANLHLNNPATHHRGGNK